MNRLSNVHSVDISHAAVGLGRDIVVYAKAERPTDTKMCGLLAISESDLTC